MHSNSHIVGAVLAKWLEPLSSGLLSSKLIQAMPALTAIENKIKNSGWTSPTWTLASDIEPFLGVMTSSLLAPMIEKSLESIPDEALPKMIYGICDKAYQMGELSILDKKICFDRNDIQRLRELLEKNLPRNDEETYNVIE